MGRVSATWLARIANKAAGYTLLLSLVLLVLGWVLSLREASLSLPYLVDEFALWAPLVASATALSIALIAALRREPQAFRIRTWFASGLIAGFYAFVAIWLHLYPMHSH